LEARLAALKAAVPLCRDQAVVRAGSLKAAGLVRLILALLPLIKRYDQQIAEVFASHPDAPIFKSLPGAGSALAPRLLVIFGSQRERWSKGIEVATYSGIAPVVERSGKYCLIHWRWACPKFVRQSFHEFAASSLLFCDWAKDFYLTQRQRGKTHHAAVRSLAFKWIRILFRIWKDRCPYDPAKYAPASA